MTVDELAAAVWATLERVADKELLREALPEGSAYQVELHVAGTVGSQKFGRRIVADTTIGHATTAASSRAPDQAHLVALLLAKLSPRVRADLLRRLPETFAELGQALPEVPGDLLAASKNLLERLRAKVAAERRPAISTAYQLHRV